MSPQGPGGHLFEMQASGRQLFCLPVGGWDPDLPGHLAPIWQNYLCAKDNEKFVFLPDKHQLTNQVA